MTQDTEAVEILRQSVRNFAEQEIAPHVMQWDEDQHFPLEIVPMVPILEWTFALFVFEICLPGEGGDACLRAYAKG